MHDMTQQRIAFGMEKIAFAKRLNEGECGGYYGDGILILSALLSGLAADLWPGKGKDRNRFVEIWALYADPKLNPNRISVPLLLAALDEDEKHELKQKVRNTNPKAFPPWNMDHLVVKGEDVDKTEADLIALDSRLADKKLRQFSYGSVFYDHVRSGYTHEYHTTESAMSFPMADDTLSVSYVNMGNLGPRLIYYDFAWVAEVVESVVKRPRGWLEANPFQIPSPGGSRASFFLRGPAALSFREDPFSEAR